MEYFDKLCCCCFVYTGLSAVEDIEVSYGARHRFLIHSYAEYLNYEPEGHYPPVKENLWTRSKPSATKRGSYDGRVFTMERLTQADDGIYTLRSKSNAYTLGTYRLTVTRECAFTIIGPQGPGSSRPETTEDSWNPHSREDSTNIQSLS